jgi:pimeloyl-ACP methyl ester carboxylesterase
MVQTRGMVGKSVALGFILGLLCCGCASRVIAPQAADTVIVVPGLGGDGPNYGGVCQALADGGDTDCLQVFNWGCGWAGMFITIYDRALHRDAEAKLADLISDWRHAHPKSRVVLIGHSAGCGVVLNAVGELKSDVGPVGPIILLAPSVSPDFDLKPALQHANVIHVFYSSGDDFWLGFGAVIFGDYDGTHRYGAGKSGFTFAGLDDAEKKKKKVIEHPFEEDWSSLGVHGGHFDWLSHDFVEKILEPIAVK